MAPTPLGERIAKCEEGIKGLRADVGRVEGKVDIVSGKLDTLLTNHIPHIERKVYYLLGALAALALVLRFAPAVITLLK